MKLKYDCREFVSPHHIALRGVWSAMGAQSSVGFPMYIRRLREGRDLSLRDAAIHSGVSHTYIMLLEKGKIINPSVDRLISLAKTYDVTAYELIYRAYPDAFKRCSWNDLRRTLIGLGYSTPEADEILRELRRRPPSKSKN